MAHQDGGAFISAGPLLFEEKSLQEVSMCSKGEHLCVPLFQPPPRAALALPSSPGCGLIPVVPVEEFEVLIVGDIDVIDLPGALVIGQVLPLDQVMDVSLFIKAVTVGTEG